MLRNSPDTLSLPIGSDWPQCWVGACDHYREDPVNPMTVEFHTVKDNFLRTIGTVKMQEILEVFSVSILCGVISPPDVAFFKTSHNATFVSVISTTISQ